MPKLLTRCLGCMKRIESNPHTCDPFYSAVADAEQVFYASFHGNGITDEDCIAAANNIINTYKERNNAATA